MATVGVVIPWAGGCAHRERALQWVLNQYQRNYPSWWITIGYSSPDRWCKAEAVSKAIQATNREILVVADADVWCDGVGTAVDHVANGDPWAIPHRLVHRLTEASTDRFIGGDRQGLDTLERPYNGHAGGGIVVTTRHGWQQAPLDPRFIGWGHEDDSWAIAMRGLLGPSWRGTAPLWHLWHPPQPRLTRMIGSVPSKELARRYHQAHKRPQALRSLLNEVNHDTPSAG